MWNPTYFIQFPGTFDEWNTINHNRRNTLSTIPEENSCLNGDSNSRPCTPAVRSSKVTLHDLDDDEEEESYFDETSFNTSQPNINIQNKTEPSAWTHNPNVYEKTIQNTRRNGRGRLPQPNYRDLPCAAPASRSNNNKSRSNNNYQRSRSNISNNNYTSNNSDHQSMGKPTFVQIQEGDNRVTTKVKATFAMEVEYSHPCTPCPY